MYYSPEQISKHILKINFNGQILSTTGCIKKVDCIENKVVIIVDALLVAINLRAELQKLLEHSILIEMAIACQVQIIFTEEKQSKLSLAGVKKVFVVVSGKGGVGKSTLSSSIAIALAQSGFNVGLLDADIYGASIPTMFDIHEKALLKDDGKIIPILKQGVKIVSLGLMIPENQPLIWRGPMTSKAFSQIIEQTAWSDVGCQPLDILIIDTPPGTGDVHMTLIAKYQIDGVLFVTTPHIASMNNVVKSVKMYADAQIRKYGAVENMSFFIDEKGDRHDIFADCCTKERFAALGIRNVWSVPMLSNIVNDINLRRNIQSFDQSVVDHFEGFQNFIMSN